MSVIYILRKEYPGDEAWKKFVSIFRPSWNSCGDKTTYLQALKNEELAVVLFATMGARSLDWFCTPVRALDNKSPEHVLSAEHEGLKILRSCIMRMPL